METKINTTENAQQNPLQTPKSSYFELITEQVQNPSLKLQQQFPKNFSLGQTQAENEHLRLQHGKGIETASQFLRK